MGWSVKTLFGLRGEAFESERRKILDEFFLSLPAESRQRSLATQFDIDEARLTMSSEEFEVWLKHELSQKLNSMLFSYQRLKKAVDSIQQQPQ